MKSNSSVNKVTLQQLVNFSYPLYPPWYIFLTSTIDVMTLHLFLFADPMDFAITTVHLTFTSSPMELCRNFTIEDDLVIEEPQEQFGLMLFTSDSAVKFGTQTASVTITDNDGMYVCAIELNIAILHRGSTRHALKLVHTNLMSGTPKKT